MLCGLYAVWCPVWAAQCVLFVRNVRRACLGGVWKGWKQKFGDISAQNYELFGYFDCSSSMISSNVGDSEKPGRGAFAG
tara:strand:+ start:849 stop:1085 length:237 start_codon:yes stop_codon:yes gene_type:complete